MYLCGMKQKIFRRENGSIDYKYYVNDSGLFHGLLICYYYNGNIFSKRNCINGKLYGLCTWWNSSGKIEKQRYFL